MYNPNQQFQQFPQQTYSGQPQNYQYQPSPNLYRPQLEEDDYGYKHEEQSMGLQGSARTNFIAKVYTLVSLQLLFTALLGYFGYNNQTFKEIFCSIAAIIIVSVAMLILSLVIACCTDFFRKYALPLFIIFTILTAILVAICITSYQSKVVLLAVGITLLIVIALTIYAWNTTTDFTGCGPYLMILGLVLLTFGIVAIFWRDPIVQLIYACLGALLFSIYLIFDTQLIIGKGNLSFSLDDAYLAAIMLYLDIINLFLSILQILGAASN